LHHFNRDDWADAGGLEGCSPANAERWHEVFAFRRFSAARLAWAEANPDAGHSPLRLMREASEYERRLLDAIPKGDIE
jgi:hypothetical protein